MGPESSLHPIFDLYTTHPAPPDKKMATMAADERIALIKENLAEWLDFEIIENIIKEGKDPKIYWGT